MTDRNDLYFVISVSDSESLLPNTGSGHYMGAQRAEIDPRNYRGCVRTPHLLLSQRGSGADGFQSQSNCKFALSVTAAAIRNLLEKKKEKEKRKTRRTSISAQCRSMTEQFSTKQTALCGCGTISASQRRFFSSLSNITYFSKGLWFCLCELQCLVSRNPVPVV